MHQSHILRSISSISKNYFSVHEIHVPYRGASANAAKPSFTATEIVTDGVVSTLPTNSLAKKKKFQKLSKSENVCNISS